MCQLIVKPAGVTITEAVLRDAWQQNDDGAGLAWRDENNEVWYQKGYFKFKHVWKAFKKVQHLDVLLHFRLATHGEKVIDNCHPFVVTNQAVIAHNGILYNYSPSLSDKRSDTRIFVESVLTPAIENNKLSADEFFGSIATKALLEAFTKGNKFAALTQKGFYIFNEQAGEWKDKVWYSAGYPPDNNWGMCYDWQSYLDHKWKRDKRGVWSRDVDYTKDPNGDGFDIHHTTAGGNHVALWQQDEATGTVRQVTTSKMDRCTICDELVTHLYSLQDDNRVCNACWQAFYGV